MINYDGVDLGELMFIRDVVRPILPGQSLETLDVEGKAGVLYMYSKDEPITLPVQVLIQGNSVELLNNKRREVAAALHKDEPKRLIFDDEPDKYIGAIVTGESPVTALATHGEAEINFFCPDPSWYATVDDVELFTEAGTYSFNRKGTKYSEPEIEVTGSFTGELGFNLNGNEMIYSGGLSAGETLIIDSSWMTAFVIDSMGNRLSRINSLSTLDFLLTAPGENTLTITGSGIEQVKLTCRSRWY